MKRPRAYCSYAELRHQTLEDESTSPWLKRAILELERRDPVDSLSDAEVLVSLFRTTQSTNLGRSRTITLNDACTSFWLKTAIIYLEQIDELDAEHDSKTLHLLSDQRMRELLSKAVPALSTPT